MKIAICLMCGTRYWSRVVPPGVGQGVYRADTHKPCLKNPGRCGRVAAVNALKRAQPQQG